MTTIYLDCTIGTGLSGTFLISEASFNNIKYEVLKKGLTEDDILVIYLCSCGGTPNSGFLLHSFISNLPCYTIVYSLGVVNSAAIQFYLGFDRRVATQESTFLIHPASYPTSTWKFPANITATGAESVESAAGFVEAVDKSTAKLISRYCDLSETELYQRLQRTYTFPETESYSYGMSTNFETGIIKDASTIVVKDI